MGTAVAFWQLRIVGPVRLPQDVGFWNGDLYNIYYPGFVFAYRGDQFLPHWNPWQLAGAPFLAGYNGGFLYPPNWIATFVPVHLALGWLCAGHLAFAGVTTLVAARTLALSWPAAFVASLTFMLSGRLVGEAFWPSYLAAHSWVPAVALAAGLFVRAPSPWCGAVLGAALASQFLTGIAQDTVYQSYLLVIAGAVAWLIRPRVDAVWSRRLPAGIVAAGATVLGLAAVQLLPTLEVVSAATRAGGLPLADAGGPASSLTELRRIVVSTGPAVGLVGLGLGAGRRRWVVAAAVAVVVAVLFGLGSPVFTVAFRTLPGVDLFRLPHRIVPIATFPLALLAGLGLDVARRRLARSPSLAARVLATAGAIGVAAVALERGPERWAGAAVLVGIAAVVLAPSRRLRRAASWAVVAAVGIERFAATRNTIMLTQNNDAAYFKPPPFVEVLRRTAGSERVLVIQDWRHRYPHMEKAGELWGLHVVGDYEPLVIEPYRAIFQPVTHIPAGRSFDGRVRPSPGDVGWRMLDLFAVRWVVVPNTVRWGPIGDRFRRASVGPDATIYENLRGMPRAYLPRRVRWVPDRAAALAAVTAPRFDPAAEVVLERADGPVPEPDGAAAGEVRVVAEANDEIVLRADTASGGVLVLTDLDWPGWHATVDGGAVPMLRADYLFRAVRVDAGSHEIRFRYVAMRFRVGALVSLMTLAGIGVLWWHARTRREVEATG